MTKVKVIPTIFVIGLLGVGAWMFAPSVKNLMDKDDGGITVTVAFDPPRRSGGPIRPGGNLLDVVSIQILVGNQPAGPTQRVKQSPWTLVLYPDRNRVIIELYAEQFTGGLLQCTIKQKGRPAAHDEGVGPTTVRCRYTVV
jgi:hypothetical protein